MSLHEVQSRIASKLGTSTRYHGEEIILHGASDHRVSALVEFDETGIVEDEIPDLEGRLQIRTADEQYLTLDSNPVKTATIQGELWHLFGPVSREAGLTKLNIRRKQSEAKYSNTTDLSDEQASF